MTSSRRISPIWTIRGRDPALSATQRSAGRCKRGFEIILRMELLFFEIPRLLINGITGFTKAPPTKTSYPVFKNRSINGSLVSSFAPPNTATAGYRGARNKWLKTLTSWAKRSPAAEGSRRAILSTEACERWALANASSRYISLQRARRRANCKLFFSSPLKNLRFSKKRISSERSCSGSNARGSSIKIILRFSVRERCAATGFNDICGTRFPRGLPKCPIKRIRPPHLSMYWIVGKMARKRKSSLIFPSLTATSKSPRTRTRVPREIRMFDNVFNRIALCYNETA